jgi:RNA polymerase sigma-70 factor (ECF subfamily)
MQETRTSLILRVADPQDHAAWNEFCELYTPLVFGHFRKMGVREHDARDLVQELLIKLLDRVRAYDRTKGRFRTWLWSVATRHAIDWMRSAGRRRAVEEAVYQQWSAAQDWEHDKPDHAFEKAYEQRVIRFACERVRQEREQTEAGRRMWRCFERYWLAGQPAGEVAAELAIDNENNVRVYAMRVLERVRAKCGDYDPELATEAI